MESLLLWWWVFAISQLVVLAYLKKEESNLVMTGVSSAVLFMSVHGFGTIIATSLFCGALGFACYKFYGLEAIESKSLFWVTCGLVVQSWTMPFLAFYLFFNTILKLAHLEGKQWKVDQHTLQLISILLTIPIYVIMS